MRTKKAALNTLTAALSEVVSIVCGLILPRLILSAFGSSYNGITSSISQFLSAVVLLRAGIGGVTRAALYKPLAEKDTEKISGIINATSVFMQRVALIFAAALIIFAGAYPFAVKGEFEWLFTATLVLIIGSSTFVDNYFGISYNMLLMADQRQYVNTLLQILTTILNTVVAAILILRGAEIHIVKLGSAVVFFLRPMFLYFYVQCNYKIDRRIKPDNSAISQRWDAFAQQAAAFVNNNTDVMVLTLFCDIKEVSVYSVYHLVTNGLYKVENTLCNGIEAAFGNMMAKGENDALQRNFKMFEFVVFSTSAFLFICGGCLIVPFVMVYTNGVTDVSYSRPLFGALACINQFLFCARLPYHMLADAAGRFKQTRNGAIFEATMNIVISIALVTRLGLIGVAIGTFCALLFRTMQYAIYSSKHILNRPMWIVIKHLLVATLEAVVAVQLTRSFATDNITSYSTWIVYALKVALVSIIIVLLFTALFYREEEKLLIAKFKKLLKKRKVVFNNGIQEET